MGPKVNLQVGVSSWLWSDHDLAEGISVQSKHGIKNVEISSDGLPSSALGDPRFLSELRQCVTVNEVNIVQTHPGGDRYDPSTDSGAEPGGPIDHLKRWVRDFAEFDRPVLVVHISEPFPTEYRRARLNTCMTNLSELVDYCAEHDTKVALETMWNLSEQTGDRRSMLGETQEEFLELVNSFDSKYLGIHIDTGHSYLLGNLTQMVELAGDRLFSLHVHDNHGRREGVPWDEHLIPGQGDIDWQGFIAALNGVHFSGTLVLEVAPEGPLEQRMREIQRSLQELGWVEQ